MRIKYSQTSHAGRRYNYAFLGLTWTNTLRKDSSLHLYKNLPSFLVNERRVEYTRTPMICQNGGLARPLETGLLGISQSK